MHQVTKRAVEELDRTLRYLRNDQILMVDLVMQLITFRDHKRIPAEAECVLPIVISMGQCALDEFNHEHGGSVVQP